MSCELYWRDGIVLVERGAADPHRDGCADCKRAHAARQELIDALPLVGASFAGEPHWQANVWRRIDGVPAEPARPWRRWQWQFPGALVAVCAIMLWLGLGRRGDSEQPPYAEVIRGSQPMRSISGAPAGTTKLPLRRSGSPSTSSSGGGHVGDGLRIVVGERSQVWIYRDKRLELWCRPGQTSSGCTSGDDGTIAELPFEFVGTYDVIVVDASFAHSPSAFDTDRAALINADIPSDEGSVNVR